MNFEAKLPGYITSAANHVKEVRDSLQQLEVDEDELDEHCDCCPERAEIEERLDAIRNDKQLTKKIDGLEAELIESEKELARLKRYQAMLDRDGALK